MRLRYAVFLLVFVSSVTAGKPPTLNNFPAEIRPSGQYARYTPDTDAFSIVYVGLDGLEPIPSDLLRDTRTFLIDCLGKKEGRYRFVAVAASKTGDQSRYDFLLVIGSNPDPTPDPKPDPPKPDPTPPVPQGFRAILITETGQTLSRAQAAVLDSGRVRDYLNSHCIDGKTGWRRWDKDQAISNENETWKSLWNAVKPKITSTPAIALVTGQTGEVFPLPTSETELMNLLKKYGGE